MPENERRRPVKPGPGQGSGEAPSPVSRREIKPELLNLQPLAGEIAAEQAQEQGGYAAEMTRKHLRK